MSPSRINPCVSPAPSKSPPRKADYLFRTHKIALDPTPAQERLLTQTADYARAAQNWALCCYKDGEKAEQEPTIDTLKCKWNDIKGIEVSVGQGVVPEGRYLCHRRPGPWDPGRERPLSSSGTENRVKPC